MIRDRRIENDTRETYGDHRHDDDQYERLSKEVDNVKLMILELKSGQSGVELPQQPSGEQGVYRRKGKG